MQQPPHTTAVRTPTDKYMIAMQLKRGTTKCPLDKESLHWGQMGGMRLITEVVPDKPKRSYYLYDAMCPKCGRNWKVRK